EPEVDRILSRITEMRQEVLSVEHDRRRWYPLFLNTSGPFWQELSGLLIDLVKNCSSAFDLSTLGKLQETTAQTERHHLAVQRTITELVPWIPLFESYPPQFDHPPFEKTFAALKSCLPYNMAFGQIPEHIHSAAQSVVTLHYLLDEDGGPAETGDADRMAAREWLEQLSRALEMAEENARTLVEKYYQIAAQAEQFVQEMDFSFLFHPQRCVFHIGFNMVTGQL
ncbi:MAG: hypothetical protein AAGU05_15955, partial [Anaerolineaceae bacterium]